MIDNRLDSIRIYKGLNPRITLLGLEGSFVGYFFVTGLFVGLMSYILLGVGLGFVFVGGGLLMIIYSFFKYKSNKNRGGKRKIQMANKKKIKQIRSRPIQFIKNNE